MIFILNQLLSSGKKGKECKRVYNHIMEITHIEKANLLQVLYPYMMLNIDINNAYHITLEESSEEIKKFAKFGHFTNIIICR